MPAMNRLIARLARRARELSALQFADWVAYELSPEDPRVLFFDDLAVTVIGDRLAIRHAVDKGWWVLPLRAPDVALLPALFDKALRVRGAADRAPPRTTALLDGAP
jgi:hypothetical protein